MLSIGTVVDFPDTGDEDIVIRPRYVGFLSIQVIDLDDYVRVDCTHMIEHDVSEALVAPTD